jgi:glycosyltransferase involved in cell wall biosynthesis
LPVRVALIGRLDPVKGHKYFLEAIASIKNSLKGERFFIVGEEKNVPLSDLKTQAQKLLVSDFVEFEGRLPDVRAFMRSCHVGVVASVGSEALSRVCLEWLAEGRPEAARAVGCLPELISTGQNGILVPPHSPQALGSALLTLIRQDEFRRQMGVSARQTATQRFGLERFAVETETLYNKIWQNRRDGKKAG